MLATVSDNRPLIIAHRGGAGLWPENTLHAFHEAERCGVDAIELDVQMTREGEPVVLHDFTVDRTTDGRGAVAELSLEEIRNLDAACRFASKGMDGLLPGQDRKIRIPTLRELFEEFSRMPLIVELKPDNPKLVQTVGDMIVEYGREKRTVFSSFSYRVVRRFRKEFPDIATAAAQREVFRFFLMSRCFVPGLYKPVADAFLVPTHMSSVQITTKRFISNAQAHRIFVAAWTVNDPDTMKKLIGLGINGLITDRPDIAFELTGKNV